MTEGHNSTYVVGKTEQMHHVAIDTSPGDPQIAVFSMSGKR
jgi:hypothetical protein